MDWSTHLSLHLQFLIISSSATMTAHIPILFLLLCSAIAVPKQTLSGARRIDAREDEKINQLLGISSNIQQVSNLNVPADPPISAPWNLAALGSPPLPSIAITPVKGNKLGSEVNINPENGSPLEVANGLNGELSTAQRGQNKPLLPQLPQVGFTVPALPKFNPALNGGILNLPPLTSIPFEAVNSIETALQPVACLFCPPPSAWTQPTTFTYTPLQPIEPSIPTPPYEQQGGRIPPDFGLPPGQAIPPIPSLRFITVIVPGKIIVQSTTRIKSTVTTTTKTLARTTRVNTATSTATRTITDLVTALAVVPPTQESDGSKDWYEEPEEGSYCQETEGCNCELEDDDSTSWNGDSHWKVKRCARK